MRIAILISLVVSIYSVGLGQDIYSGVTGATLQQLLVDNYKPQGSLMSYANTRDTMYKNVYRDEDGYVSCYYTGHKTFLPDGVDPSAFLWDNDNPNGITAEHIYPQSKGASNGNARVDMHSLVPCILRANQARSNYPFGEIADEETDHWYNLTQDLIDTPSLHIDDYSEKLNGGFSHLGKFEPRESVKGDIARAVFYFYTMYKAEANAADDSYFDSMKEELFLWHLADPVDELENLRNIKKAPYQFDKINPFIADCSLVSRAYFPTIGGICDNFISRTNDSDKQAAVIYPNPVEDVLYIKNLDQDTKIKIYSIAGELLLKAKTYGASIDVSALDQGIYFITVSTKQQSNSIRFIKS